MAINYGGWQADLFKDTGAGIVLPPDEPDEAKVAINSLEKTVGRV